MAKLTLRCGRFIPPAAGDTEGRLRSMERYLARLTEELEHGLGTGELSAAEGNEASSMLYGVAPADFEGGTLPSVDTVTAVVGDGEGDSHEQK